jgi:hypothetical protein
LEQWLRPKRAPWAKVPPVFHAFEPPPTKGASRVSVCKEIYIQPPGLAMVDENPSSKCKKCMRCLREIQRAQKEQRAKSRKVP